VQLKNKILGKTMSHSDEKLEKDDQESLSGDEIDKFDGFYFVPDYDDYDEIYKLAFFKFKDEWTMAKPIEKSEMGYKYHMAFFREDENGVPSFDDAFEAILSDPLVYIKNLVGSGLSGCIVKKTEQSENWWTEYLDFITNGTFKKKVNEALKSIAE
jgi:hypothetical protein